jgi:hypothetical protein
MTEHQQLLDEARRFCDPTTGEVIERMPEELMRELRAAKLARGIPGKPSQRTESYATWFVFLNSEIRDRVLAEWRAANAARKRGRGEGERREATADSSVTDTAPNAERPSERGLKAFRKRRKSVKWAKRRRPIGGDAPFSCSHAAQVIAGPPPRVSTSTPTPSRTPPASWCDPSPRVRTVAA